MRILVAGAGIAGSCTATVLREAGHDVVLADGQPHLAASRCAFALTRMSWWKGEQRAAVARSLDWYADRDRILTDTAVVHDIRRGRTEKQGGYLLIDPVRTLVKSDLPSNVSWWTPDGDGVLVRLRNGIQDWKLDALVIACGPATGYIARQAPGVHSYGGIFTAPGNRLADPGRLALLRRTDRLSYTAAYVGSGADSETRIGASRSLTAGEAYDSAVDIRARLLSEGVVTGHSDEWTYRAGTRYATVTPGARHIAARVWTLSGLARSGYALAPAAALDIATEIGELE